MTEAEDAVRRRNAVAEYRKKLLQHKELESRVRSGWSHNPLPIFTLRIGFSNSWIFSWM